MEAVGSSAGGYPPQMAGTSIDLKKQELERYRGLLLNYLENSDIRADQDLYKILDERFMRLIQRDPPVLSEEEKGQYGCATRLFVDNKVSRPMADFFKKEAAAVLPLAAGAPKRPRLERGEHAAALTVRGDLASPLGHGPTWPPNEVLDEALARELSGSDSQQGLASGAGHPSGNALSRPLSSSPLGAAPSSPSMSPEIFGKDKWLEFGVDVGDEPPRPTDIDQLFGQDCLVWPGKKVKDTNRLVLIPKEADGCEFNLNNPLLHPFVHFPSPRRGGHKKKCYGISNRALMEKSPDQSYWVLMTKEIIPGSTNTTFEDQRILLFVKRCLAPSLLEGVAHRFLGRTKNGIGEWIVPGGPGIRCVEEVEGYQVVVGSTFGGVLNIYPAEDSDAHPGIGVVGVWRKN